MDGARWQNPWCKLEPVAGADRLVVVFSHINEPQGRFSLYGSFRAVKAHRLFVNAPGNCWYQDGVPGLGASVAETATALSALAATLAPTAVSTVGISMGGYAALLFGSLIGADAMLAFGPETRLRQPGSRSSYAMKARPGSAQDDLLPILARRKGQGRVHIVAGEADAIDMVSAERVRSLPGVAVRTLKGVGHEVARPLHKRGLFAPLLAGFVAGDGLPDALPLEGALLTVPGVAAALEEGCRLRRAGDLATARARFDDALAAYPDAALAHDELGLAAGAAGDHAAAEHHHRRAAEIGPEWPAPFHHLGLALLERGRFAEAEAALRQAIALSPQPRFQHPLGLALLRQKRFAEAEAALAEAAALKPPLPGAQPLLEEARAALRAAVA